MAAEGTYKAYFRGNGANVIKNVPETALKLTCNDRVKAMIASDGHTVSLGATSYLTCLALFQNQSGTILCAACMGAKHRQNMPIKRFFTVVSYCWQLPTHDSRRSLYRSITNV